MLLETTAARQTAAAAPTLHETADERGALRRLAVLATRVVWLLARESRLQGRTKGASHGGRLVSAADDTLASLEEQQ